MLIALKKFGTTLISRPTGKEAFLTLPPLGKDNEIIEIDFEGVAVLTPSWADEFITPLVDKYGDRVILTNTENPSVQATLETLEKVKKDEKTKPNSVPLYILITLDNKTYKYAKIVINRAKGDIYYFPSQTFFTQHGRYSPISGDDNINTPLPLDHFVLHEDGVSLLKTKKGDYIPLHRPQPIPIKKIGQIFLLVDFVKDVLSLPEFNKPIKGNIVFNAVPSFQKYFVRIDLMSGKNYLAKDFDSIPAKDKEGELIDFSFRAIGFESGNADKMMIIGFYKYINDINQERRVFFPLNEIRTRTKE